MIWSAIFLTAFIPLYLKFPSLFVSGTFVTVRLEDFLLLGLYFIFGLSFWQKSRRDLQPIIFLFGWFFVFGLLSLLISYLGFGYLDLKLGLLHWARRIEYMSIFFLGLLFPFSRVELKKILIMMTLVSGLVSLYALGQKYLTFPAVSTINSELSKGTVYHLTPFDRVNSTFSGHYDLAAYLLIHIPLLLGMVVFFLEKKQSRCRYLLILGVLMVVGVNFYVLMLTAARLSFVALIISTLGLFILLKKWRWLMIAGIFFVGSLLYPSELRDRFVSTLRVNVQKTWTGYKSNNSVQEKRSQLNIPTLPADNKRVGSIGVDSADIVPGEPTDTTDLGVFRSLAIRLQVEWPRALVAFRRNPVTGMGYSSLGLATDNDWLRILGEIGLVGFVIFTSIVVFLGKNLMIKVVDQEHFFVSRTALAVFIGFLINSLFIDVFEASKIAILFWLYFGIVVGYLKEGYEKKI
jgi:hypothetical protein